MQNKFTQKAQNTLRCAMTEAGNLGHAYIGSEHLLLALAAEKDSIAARILFARGLGVAVIKAAIVGIDGDGEKCRPSAQDMTPRAKRIIESSGEIAKKKGCTYIGTEHLLSALLSEDGCTAVKIIESAGLPITLLIGDLNAHQSSFSPSSKERAESASDTDKSKSKSRTPVAIALYSKDMTKSAAEGKTDPTIARDKETERIIQILSRRTKNNPCLIGEPGVGKTAVVEGLAKRIADRAVPACLQGKRILCLDIPSMIAGAKYRGEFEERMKNVMAEAEKDPDIILFIDELHVIIGAGAAEGAVDAANILKPALARGGIRLIGATTVAEYRKHIEHDSALERRFQAVLIEEPSVNNAIEILKGLRPSYEAHHKLKISDSAIEAAVRLSARYVNDRFLPDKAIDMIDEAAAKMTIAASARFPSVSSLERQLSDVKRQKDDCMLSQDFSSAAELRDREIALKAELDGVKREMRKKKNQEFFTLGEEQIAEMITEQTGIPVNRLLGGETQALVNLEERIEKRIIGQSAATEAVCSAIRRGRVGIRDPLRPTGSFIFLGKTGVGKTELARAIAEELLGSKKALIRFDMSEYMEKHSVSKLIGSPPGYVGYGEGGLLTEKVRRRPYSVLLFDEIEKAHPDVFNLLLQVLEDGKLCDSQGREVNFCNTVIIMTSNVGASAEKRISGFASDTDARKSRKDAMLAELRREFKPEFLNRVDEIIVFDDLDADALEKIASMMLKRLSERAKELGLDISFEPSVAKAIARESQKEGCGARNIRRTITQRVENKISLLMLEGAISPSAPYVFTENDIA